MSLEDFSTSESNDQETEETSESRFANCREDPLIEPDEIDLPDYVSVWVSDDGLMAMMEVPPETFRDKVSTEVKDRAKEKGLVFWDSAGEDDMIVLTDDPEGYGTYLNIFGLEDYLLKRVEGAI